MVSPIEAAVGVLAIVGIPFVVNGIKNSINLLSKLTSVTVHFTLALLPAHAFDNGVVPVIS